MKSKTDSDNDEYKIAMGCIDIFSKFAVVIALHNKQSDTLLDGMKQVFKLMGKPAVLMTDQEGGLQTQQVGDYLKKRKRLLISLIGITVPLLNDLFELLETW